MLKVTDPERVNPDGEEEAMPLPTDSKVIYLGGLFLLASAAQVWTRMPLKPCVRRIEGGF